MKITILGTGVVGQTLAAKLISADHDVTMGTRNKEVTLSRTDPNPMTGTSFSQWYKDNPLVKLVNYPESVKDSAIIINAISGSGSVDALKAAGKENIAGKVLIDISNPLDFSKGMPPSLFISNTDSLGELIQREFPETKVVKALNTMNANLMLNPSLLEGDHNVFVSGNDAGAKTEVKRLLTGFGWKEQNIIDLGDITTSRGTEQLLPVWIRLWFALGNPNFNFHIVK